MGGKDEIIPDETYDPTGTVEDLTPEEFDRLEAKGAAEDAEALVSGKGFADEQPDPEADEAWLNADDDAEEPDHG